MESLLAAMCPDDMLRFHQPLLGVTLTRPILYLMGLMGGVGRHAGGRCVSLALSLPAGRHGK